MCDIDLITSVTAKPSEWHYTSLNTSSYQKSTFSELMFRHSAFTALPKSTRRTLQADAKTFAFFLRHFMTKCLFCPRVTHYSRVECVQPYVVLLIVVVVSCSAKCIIFSGPPVLYLLEKFYGRVHSKWVSFFNLFILRHCLRWKLK